jgi:(4-O-methyl)-D-glucuronate---lignin esterase
MNLRNQELTRREFIRLTSTGFAVAAVAGTGFDGLTEVQSHSPHETQEDRLVEDFMRPPDESRPWCYWYWMNGNITREGIRADLEGLAEVGVGGVLLFDIGVLPAGPVVNRSQDWYDLVKFAVAEAAKRNIKMSLNCPGWSGSGGPWITPELAMQELTWSETLADGEREFSAVLQQPPTRLECYRDAAVIAFPVPDGDEALPLPQVTDIDGNPLPEAASALKEHADLPATLISQTPAVPDTEPVLKGNTQTAVDLPAEFDLVFPQPVVVRSLYVRGARASGPYQAELFVQDDVLKTFRLVSRFGSHPGGPFSANIGSASFAPVRASKFRLAFSNRKEGARIQIEALRISSGFRVTNWTSKAGFSSEPVSADPSDCRPQNGDVIPLQQVVDLSDKLGADGRLGWSVPPGRWTILRIGYTPTGIYLYPTPNGGAGLDCDKLSREAADFHYDHCIKPLLREFGPELSRQALAYYHVDSYESGWQNWSAKFSQDFRERRGYDLTKYLPALTGRVVGSIETTEKFLWDFRRTIGDLFADNNYGRLAERCHEDGLGFSTEPYGGPFEQLQVGLRADHPMTEVWLPGKEQEKKIWFQAVLSGRTAGRKILGAESFTSEPPAARWNTHPFSLKPLGDFIYCCGVNQYCIHVNAHHPLIGDHLRPGFTCGMNGIHFDRGNTWWQHGAKEWVNYIMRCQSVLQTGEHVADVLYFQGNDSPAGVGPFDPALPEGYDFDDCGSEILESALVHERRVVLPSGKSYGYLVLPSHGRVTLASLRRIASLARNGARIVGVPPHESPSLADVTGKDEYERLSRELATYVRAKQSFQEILAADKVLPDFSFDKDAGLVLHYTHRHAGDAEFYFVASASPNVGAVECIFRVAGKIPELWRPDSGTMEPCAVYEQSGGTTRIPLHFDPAGSVFVVFRPGAPKPHATAISFADTSALPMNAGFASLPWSSWSDGKRLELHAWQAGRYNVTMPNQNKHVFDVAPLPAPQTVEGPWTLQFPAGWGAPARINMDKLISWPEFPDAGVRYFSGTATYKTTFRATKMGSDCRLFLDLGRVEVIAEVWLNGKFLGTFWKPPFICEVTELLRAEVNELEVQVTNLWPNRLIGDEQFPDDCSENGQWKSGAIPAWPEWLKSGQARPEPRRLTFCTWKHWGRNDAPQPSGLLGPVTLQQVRTVKITSS